MRSLALSAALFVAVPAHAEDRWMTIPAAPEMPAPVATGNAPVNEMRCITPPTARVIRFC